MDVQDRALLRSANIDLDELIGDFGLKTITRGKSYFVKNKVVSILSVDVLKNDKLNITGVVTGSHANVYKCEVEIMPSLFSTEVLSICECPVYGDCKHGIALLFAYLYSGNKAQIAPKKPELSDQQKIDKWFELISDSELEIKEEAEDLYKIPSEKRDCNKICVIAYH